MDHSLLAIFGYSQCYLYYAVCGYIDAGAYVWRMTSSPIKICTILYQLLYIGHLLGGARSVYTFMITLVSSTPIPTLESFLFRPSKIRSAHHGRLVYYFMWHE